MDDDTSLASIGFGLGETGVENRCVETTSISV